MTAVYRFGETNPVILPILTAQGCLVGDLLQLSSGNAIRAEDVAWGSAIASPSAPTATNAAVAIGTALTNGAYHIQSTYTTSYGETAASASAAVTPTAGAGIAIAKTVLPAGVTGMNFYMEDSAGSGNFYLVASTFGQAFIITGSPDTGAPVAPTVTTLGALQVTQYAFRQGFVGCSGQRKIANVAQTGTGGGAANFIRVAPDGVWEFDCVSQTFNVGDLVGPAKQTGNLLYSSTLDLVANPNLAIGRVETPYASATVKVRAKINSKKLAGLSVG